MRQRFEINFPVFSEYVPEAGSRGPVEIELFNREGGCSVSSKTVPNFYR